ncbi:MAG: RimK family alpha-L-glutamate ligase [Planctomycetes bacterium]|nr:RimK family alpha-L-glutamate ligase [Planctomycetota bacterium]
MRLAVLSSADSWYFADLHRAAGNRHQVECLSFHRLSAELGFGHGATFSAGESRLDQFDAILVRTMAPGTLEQVVFRMDVLGRIERQGTPVVNPPRALEAAVDKYLALAKLQAAGLRIPPTVVCQTYDDAMAGYEQLEGNVVVKPLFGSEGRGLLRVEDPGLAQRVFKTLGQLGAVMYLQKFIPHDGFDIRLLLIGPKVLAVRRRNPSDWRTNLSRGAIAEPFDPARDLIDMAQRAAIAVGAPLAGVDILPGRDGQMYLLEVNAVPGWQSTARSLDVDVAALVLDYVDSRVHGDSDDRGDLQAH